MVIFYMSLLFYTIPLYKTVQIICEHTDLKLLKAEFKQLFLVWCVIVTNIHLLC